MPFMKPNQSTVGKLLVLGCILLLVSAILPWRIPLFRILLALAAVWLLLAQEEGQGLVKRREII